MKRKLLLLYRCRSPETSAIPYSKTIPNSEQY